MAQPSDTQPTMDTIINYSLSVLLNLLLDGSRTTLNLPQKLIFKNDHISLEFLKLCP